LIIDLPTCNDCGDHSVNLQVQLNLTCSGPNYVNSTLCPSVYDQVATSGIVWTSAPIDFTYTFCPTIEETALETVEFTICQEDKRIEEGGELESGHPLNGTITLEVVSQVVDSAFESANIKSILLFEKIPSKDTLPFLDVTGKAVIETGFQPHPNKVQISFSYIPRIFELTKKLKNWFTGLYFVVTIDVNYQPVGIPDLSGGGKREDSPAGTVVRLEIPSKPIRPRGAELGEMPSAESAKSTSTGFKVKEVKSSGRREAGEIKENEEFSEEKGKMIEQQLKSEAQKNQIIEAVMIVSLCLCALIIVGFVGVLAYNYTRKGNNIQLQTN